MRFTHNFSECQRSQARRWNPASGGGSGRVSPASAAAPRAAAAQRGPRHTTITTPSLTSGARGERRARGSATRPVGGKPEPRGRAGKSRRGRPEPRHRKRSPRPYGAPTLRRALRGWEGNGTAPTRQAHGSGSTARAPSSSPGAPGPGEQPAALRALQGTWISASRWRPETRPRPRKKVAPRGAQNGARRAPLRLPLPAAASSSRASPPQLRPRLRSPLPAPSLQGARRPQSGALSAPAAPWVPVGAVPRDAPLQPRAALLQAGRAGG